MTEGRKRAVAKGVKFGPKFKLNSFQRQEAVARLKAGETLKDVAKTYGADTKRGNRDLRMLFVQGARAILLRPKSWVKHSFGPWLTTAARRLHRNILTIALANKLARIALSVLIQGRSYETRIVPAAA